MSDDVAKELTALLDYWQTHNREHEEEFRSWAAKAEKMPIGTAKQLRLAAALMAEAGKCLDKSRQALTGK